MTAGEGAGHTEGPVKLCGMEETERGLVFGINGWVEEGIRGDARLAEVFSKEANARRFVALWNMAERLGLKTEDIESGLVGEMAEALYMALPYVESALEDKGYKPGVVDQKTKQIRAVLSRLPERGR